MIALEWADINLPKRQLCVQRSEWDGHVTSPKSGRLRHIPLTTRLAKALRDHRHLRSPRVLSSKDGAGLTRKEVRSWVRRAARRAQVQNDTVHVLSAHVLFAPGDARGSSACHPGVGGARQSLDDAAVHASESSGD